MYGHQRLAIGAGRGCRRDQCANSSGRVRGFDLLRLGFMLRFLLAVDHVQGSSRRDVAVCKAANLKGTDVNAAMVAEGWALAYRRYSKDYVKQEQEARKAGLGVWRGAFVKPWEWRRLQRSKSKHSKPSRTNTTDVNRCLIKGNIGRRGVRIYHVPGGTYYSRTKISRAKGERWFCSEAAASAAGWRKSKR